MEEVYENENDITSIRVTVKTRERLKVLGKKGESFEDILVKILDAQKE